jgi:hypothetical protein
MGTSCCQAKSLTQGFQVIKRADPYPGKVQNRPFSMEASRESLRGKGVKRLMVVRLRDWRKKPERAPEGKAWLVRKACAMFGDHFVG